MTASKSNKNRRKCWKTFFKTSTEMHKSNNTLKTQNLSHMPVCYVPDPK